MSDGDRKDATEDQKPIESEYVQKVETITLPDVPLDELPRGFFPGDKITVITFRPK